jgi:hypothetical protein
LAFNNADRTVLTSIEEDLHSIIRMLIIMSKGMDALVSAVDNNATATDALSAEVQEAVEWIKNHSEDNDPALLALAARLEEKNAKANKAKDDLDSATKDAAEEEHARGM